MTKKVYFISLAAVLLASVYPIYMGIIMILAYIKNGGIDAADYPKYVIPYTPICFALIICAAILPLIYTQMKKFAFPALSLLGVGLFLLAESFFEQMVVFSSIFEERSVEIWEETAETWQWFMCIAPPETFTRTEVVETVEIISKNPLISEYSPVFKIHFYAISLLIVLVVIGVIYGFYKMAETNDYSKKKPLTVKLISVIIFIGLCIFACFTAFFRTGDINLSPVSAVLQTSFFLVFGITGGVYIGTGFYGKRKLLSLIIPSVSAMLVTMIMYFGEMVMMNHTLYKRGEGFIFEPLGAFPLSLFDIAVIILSGAVTYFILFKIQPIEEKPI